MSGVFRDLEMRSVPAPPVATGTQVLLHGTVRDSAATPPNVDNPGSASPSSAASSLHRVLNRASAVILVLGLASSILIYVFAQDAGIDPTRELAHAKMYRHDVELIGGKGALYAAQFGEWFSDLWHGRRLAWTIAVVTAALAGACFLFGRLIREPPAADSDGRPADRGGMNL